VAITYNIHVNKWLGYVGEYKALCCRGNITLPGRYGGELIRGTSFCGLSLVGLFSLLHKQQYNNPPARLARMIATGCQQWPSANLLRTVTGDLHIEKQLLPSNYKSLLQPHCSVYNTKYCHLLYNVQTRYHLPLDIRGDGKTGYISTFRFTIYTTRIMYENIIVSVDMDVVGFIAII